MMLAHIAQHPFEQPAGRGEERLRRTPQPSAERREHLIAGAGVVVAVDHPLRAQRDPRLGQALGEPRQPVARRRQPRLAAEKPELVRMLRRDTGDQLGRWGDRVGHHQRQGAVAGGAVKQHHRQLFAELLIVGIAVHTRGDNQAIDLAGDHVIDHHALLTWVFVGAGDKQLHAGFPAERLKLVGENGKPVVGDLRHHQTNGMAAVIAQRARVNARLIVLFTSDRQYALARLLRHAQLFTTTVEYQAGGRFGDARQFGDIFDSYAFGFHQHPGA